MRYGVGVDHLSYMAEYQRITLGLSNRFDDTETGFRFIRDTLAQWDVHSAIYFGLIAFIQLWLVFKAVKSDKFIYPYLVISFFLGCIWLTYANGLRQQLAFGLFAYSLLFVDSKKLLPLHYILLLLAVSMHQSAVILFILAPLLRKKWDWFTNIKVQYLLLAVAIIIGRLPQIESWLIATEDNMGILEGYLEETGYDQYYSYNDGENIFRDKGTTGIGYFIEMAINIVLIWFCNATKQFNKNDKLVSYIYNFTYLGILLHYAFIASPVIARVNYYFYGFAYVFGAYTLHYLYNRHRKMFWVLLGLYMLTFIGTMYRMHDNTSAFYFFWQRDLYGK